MVDTSKDLTVCTAVKSMPKPIIFSGTLNSQTATVIKMRHEPSSSHERLGTPTAGKVEVKVENLSFVGGSDAVSLVTVDSHARIAVRVHGQAVTVRRSVRLVVITAVRKTVFSLVHVQVVVISVFMAERKP